MSGLNTPERLRLFLGLGVERSVGVPLVGLVSEMGISVDTSMIDPGLHVWSHEYRSRLTMTLIDEGGRTVGELAAIVLDVLDFVDDDDDEEWEVELMSSMLQELSALVGRHFSKGASMHVWLHEDMWGRGIARAMYEVAGRIVSRDDIPIVSGSFTGGTSPDAQRIWRGLCARHPSVCCPDEWTETGWAPAVAWLGP